MDDDVCDRTAVELARAIRARDLSAREVLDAHLQRIDLWNPVVNAIVTRTTGRAVARAGALDEAFARGEEPGPLHGVPTAHKDLVDTAGIRTTYGSPIYADHVPDADEPFVARLREAGPSSSARRTRPSSAPARIRSTRCSGRRATPTTCPAAPAGRRAARPRRSRPAWCRSPTGATSAGRFATRRASATSSGSGRR